MNFRVTVLLFGILLGMLWLFGLMVAVTKKGYQEELVIPSLSTNPKPTIEQIELVRTGKSKDKETFIFSHEGKDGWMMEQPPAKQKIKVESFKVERVLNQVRDTRRFEAADVIQDPARYGIDKPQAAITLRGKGADDKTREWKLDIGKTSADEGTIYVISSDKPDKVIAVRKGTLDSVFFDNPNSFRAQRLFDFSDFNAGTLIVKENQDGKATAEVEIKKHDDGTWRFVKPNLGFADYEGPQPEKREKEPFAATPPKQEGGLKNLLSTISTMRVASEDDFVPPTDSGLGFFGLEEGKERFRIQVVSMEGKKEGKTETLLLGIKVKDKEQYYGRMAGDTSVFKLEVKTLEPLLKLLQEKEPGSSLRSLDIVHVDTKALDAIDLKTGKDLKQVIELRHREMKPWRLMTAADKSTKANETTVNDLLDAVQGKRAIQKFLPVSEADAKSADAELGFTTPQAEVVAYTDGLEKVEEKKDEKKLDFKEPTEPEPKMKKDAKPAVTLTFGKTDGDQVVVKRVTQDGTTSRFAVAKSVLDKVAPAEGVLAFRSAELPALATGDISRIEIVAGSKHVEIERNLEGKTPPWRLKNVKDLAGKDVADTSEVLRILDILSRLQAKKWVEKIEPKADLSKFGLQKPDVKVTVYVRKERPAMLASALGMLLPLPLPLQATAVALGRDILDKGDPITYEFGNETAKEPATRYARHSETDLVFVVDTGVAKAISEADVRDHSWLLQLQPIANASVWGMLPQPPQTYLAVSPLYLQRVHTFDAAQVKELRLTVRARVETRKFAFGRKDKTWLDQSGLLDFTPDPEKVNQLAETLADLRPDRFILLKGGPKPEHKLGADKATLTCDVVLQNGKTITLSVGDRFEGHYFFAHSTAWPQAVFLLAPDKIGPWLQGANYFGKERVAAE